MSCSARECERLSYLACKSADSLRLRLLAPLGSHRRDTKCSRGKRARRKVKSVVSTAEESQIPAVAPKPLISEHLDVGFNAISKSLQNSHLSRQSSTELSSQKPHKQYLGVFVARGDQSPVLDSHFPQMVGAASKALPDNQKIRLVGFSRSCAEKLALSVGLPRVSSVAIRADAPGAAALQELVRSIVPPVQAPWLSRSASAEFSPTKINSAETVIGTKKARNT